MITHICINTYLIYYIITHIYMNKYLHMSPRHSGMSW